jgi:hypothetical protein
MIHLTLLAIPTWARKEHADDRQLIEKPLEHLTPLFNLHHNAEYLFHSLLYLFYKDEGIWNQCLFLKKLESKEDNPDDLFMSQLSHSKS